MTTVSKNLSRLTIVLALAILAFFTSISAASAHDELIGSDPKSGSTLKEAPAEITLEFSGELQSLSGVEATVVSLTHDGDKVTTKAQTKGTKVIVTPDEELANGKYSLAYRVVSSDGHPIENKIGFALEAPQAEPSLVSTAPEESPTASPEPSSATPIQDLGSSVSPVIWVIIGVVVLGGAIGVLAKFMRNSK